MKKILIFAIVLAGMATEVLAVTDLAAWESDLKLYESRLPSRHPLLFFKVKHSVFRENLSRLKSSLPKLTDGQAYLELQRVTAAMSDDHTAVASTEIMRNMEQYPLAIRVFGNELYILAIAEENKQALGAKIISIGGVPIAAALSKVAPYISTASRVTVKTKLPNIFSFVDLWRLVGLAQADGSIEINCQAGDKEPFALVLSPQTPTTMAERKNKIARLKTVTCPTSYRSNQFYFTLKLDEGSTLYVQYNKCWGKEDGGELLKNWPHPESVPSHDDFFDEIRRELVTGKITKFIFGPVPRGGMHSAMFGVMEDVQDILREYMLRLLSYKGQWCTYGQKRDIYRTIS